MRLCVSAGEVWADSHLRGLPVVDKNDSVKGTGPLLDEEGHTMVEA